MTDSGNKWLLGGGIGSGKSTVRTILEGQGVETIDADSIGHSVLEPGGAAFADVARHWPDTVREGRIDRSVLAGIVFSDPVQLATLESLTHPHIFGRIVERVEGIRSAVVVEMPLLTRTPPGVWRRLVVDCDDEIRLRRLIERGVSEHDARSRMRSQPSRAQWLAVADLVVPNHGDLDELTGTVGRLLGEISPL